MTRRCVGIAMNYKTINKIWQKGTIIFCFFKNKVATNKASTDKSIRYLIVYENASLKLKNYLFHFSIVEFAC